MKKNNRNKLEISLLIYTADRNRLWQFRNLCYEIQEITSCKLNISLTCSLQTAYDMLLYISGGVDLFINDEILTKECEEILYRRIKTLCPACRVIARGQNGYTHTFYVGKGLKIIEHWKDEEIVFADNLHKLIERLVKQEEKQ